MPVLFEKIATNPKQLFLIDGIGALISVFFLGVVLVRLQLFIGLPKSILYDLAVAPCFFALYSFGCYFLLTANWATYLKIIAIANFMYCFVSIWILHHHSESLTVFGWCYFILELLILFVLIVIEWKSASKK